jgi:hypothetical protein
MKKQRKSTTPRGAEPGIGKANTIKGIQATPYIDLEDNMKKQTTSEKKLFAEIKKLDNLVKWLVSTTQTQHGMIEELRSEQQVFDDRLNAADAQATLSKTPAKPDPKDYVLTDADWQRVIKEGWLCEFETASGTSRSIGTLEEIRAGDYCHHAHGYFTKCRPLNKPGVLQPYFGQGCPVPAGTKVLTKQRRGSHCIGKALEQGWDIENNSSDIVAFMVLEQ